MLVSLDVVAELHTTKRIRELAEVLREEAGKQGADLHTGDDVERMIADRVTSVAQRMGVTPRTVLANYVTDEQVREWGTGLALELREAELVTHDTPPVVVSRRDGLMVLAAFGVCGTLALRNAERRQDADPMVVVKDAADSTTEVAVSMFEGRGDLVEIGGLTLVVGRKVISMTLEALRHGWWDCTCEQPHRPDGGCGLQDRLAHDLAVLGGWLSTGEQIGRSA